MRRLRFVIALLLASTSTGAPAYAAVHDDPRSAGSSVLEMQWPGGPIDSAQPGCTPSPIGLTAGLRFPGVCPGASITPVPTAGAVPCPFTVPTRVERCELWASLYDYEGAVGFDVALAAEASPDGSRVFVTGWSNQVEGPTDWATVGYDAATGQELWAARENGPGNDMDLARAIAVDPSGRRVYVAGYISGPGSRDIGTAAYDAATGDRIWIAAYDGPVHGDDEGFDVAVSPDESRVYVTGRSRGGATGDDFTTVAYEAATGKELWAARTGEAGKEAADALAVSPDGGTVFVTGQRGPDDRSDYLTVAYEAEDPNRYGEVLWLATYSHSDQGPEAATDMAVSPDGEGVFVTGQSEDPETGSDLATVGYRSDTGEQLWVGRLDGLLGGWDRAEAVAVTEDRVVATGWSIVFSLPPPLLQDTVTLTVAYDVDSGRQEWMDRYDGLPGGDDGVLDVAQAPDGSKVYVAGASAPPVGYTRTWDSLTIAYDVSTGSREWVTRFDSGNLDFSFAVAAAGGRVFIAGTSFTDTDVADYHTVAYAI